MRDSDLLELHQQGWSAGKIAKHYGFNEASVRSRINKSESRFSKVGFFVGKERNQQRESLYKEVCFP